MRLNRVKRKNLSIIRNSVAAKNKQKKQNNVKKNSVECNTPAIGVNFLSSLKKKDNSGMVYYNCDKKSYIS